MKQLKKLNLAQNQIYNIDISLIYKLSKSLQILDLSYNLIKTVTSVEKKENSSLRSLYVQNNELKWADLMILVKNLLNLTDINADFNKLNDIPFDTNNNDGVLEALLSIEQTTTLDNLKDVSLQGNNLNEFGLLKFMNSKIKLRNLTHLNLARNKLFNIPERFFTSLNLYNLKMLTLDRNSNLNLFKTTFTGLEDSLETLNMNQIGFSLNSIEILNDLKNLKYLRVNGNTPRNDMTGNAMHKLNVNLIGIEMQNSNLVAIPKFICESNSLQEIDLSYNKLKIIPENCLQNKKSLLKLNLNSNPLKCDCKLNYLKSWLDNKYKANTTTSTDNTFELFELLFDWRCNEPESLRTKNLINLSKNDLKCDFASLIRKTDNLVAQVTSTTVATILSSPLLTSTKESSNVLNYILNGESLFSNTLSVSEEAESELEESMMMGKNVADSLSNNTYYIIIGGIFGIATFVLSILLLIYTIYVKKFDGYYEKNAQRKAIEDAEMPSGEQQPAYFDLSYLQKEVSTANTTATNNSNSSIIELFRKNYKEKSSVDPNQYLVSHLNDNVLNNFMNSDAIKNSKIFNSGNGNILIIPNSTISSSLSSFSDSTATTNLGYPNLSTIPYDYYDSKYPLTNFTHYV